jgi:hypothetical protein
MVPLDPTEQGYRMNAEFCWNRVLKGHGFSRAGQCAEWIWPLGPEAGFSLGRFPQGLKPTLN